MSEPENTDRREATRVDIEMWVEESRERETYFQRCTNLSAGGLFLDRTIPHVVGTIVRLRFTLPDGAESIETRGEIVNAADGDRLGMGVKFLDLPEDARGRIVAFVAREKK
jgi:uncharacterized protein (TIGR02266 family)